MLRRSLFLAIALLVTLATTQIAFAEEDAKAKAGITMGDGEANWIRLEGLPHRSPARCTSPCSIATSTTMRLSTLSSWMNSMLQTRPSSKAKP